MIYIGIAALVAGWLVRARLIHRDSNCLRCAIRETQLFEQELRKKGLDI
jgi:hypothetical protein